MFVLVLILFPLCAVFPQEGTAPVPYEEDEFPLWQRDLRRFEVVLIGSFPFTMLYSSLGYGVIRWGINGFDQGYAPTLRPDADTVPLTTDEKLGVVLSGVGLSAAVAIIDLIIIHVKRNSANVEDSLTTAEEDG